MKSGLQCKAGLKSKVGLYAKLDFIGCWSAVVEVATHVVALTTLSHLVIFNVNYLDN